MNDYEFYVIDMNQSKEMYKHLIQDKVLYIMKDKKIILELKDKEIMKMLEPLGIATKDFKNGFNE